MTRTDESLGGLVRRARISSAEARLPSAKRAFMISRSRRVRRSAMCDICHRIHATGVACQAPKQGWGRGSRERGESRCARRSFSCKFENAAAGSQARVQLGGLERLGDVVVSACLQGGDQIFAAGRQARAIGGLEGGPCLLSAAHHHHLIVPVRQHGSEHARRDRIVAGYQDPHADLVGMAGPGRMD
ncbi:hypothetical protein SBA4_7120014 [Candidatus Sulfopaludibacter sp. SbA4]|nr:hypothetical protein SBA4_7120014 [Candidatus Sulfopaludibacter sp. SbA4]